MRLPTSARGVTWFWGILPPGDSMPRFASRYPPAPDLPPEAIWRWTKLVPGDQDGIYLMLTWTGEVFSYQGAVEVMP